MSADFFSLALSLSPAQAQPLRSALDGSEVEYRGNVYCDVSISLFAEHLTNETPLTVSPSFPAFVALDRFVARPDGLRLLNGRAHRWVPPEEVAELAATVRALARSPSRSAAVEMVERGGNGQRDVEAGLAALERAATRAGALGEGVLLACVPS